MGALISGKGKPQRCCLSGPPAARLEHVQKIVTGIMEAVTPPCRF